MPHVNELHEQHDPILIVSLAGGDLAAADRDYATAQSLIGSCADCARLHDDVLALASATKALPPAVRTRDFTISPEQAAKLRPAGVRGILARLTAPGGLFSRQLGVGLATLGIAGLLIGSLPPINIGMGGAASTPSQAASAPEQAIGAAPAGSPAASGAPDQLFSQGAAEAAASAAAPYSLDNASGPPPTGVHTTRNSSDGAVAIGATPSPAPTPAPADRDLAATATPDLMSSDGPSPLVIVSTALLVAGALILLGRRLARGGRSG